MYCKYNSACRVYRAGFNNFFARYLNKNAGFQPDGACRQNIFKRLTLYDILFDDFRVYLDYVGKNYTINAGLTRSVWNGFLIAMIYPLLSVCKLNNPTTVVRSIFSFFFLFCYYYITIVVINICIYLFIFV